MNLKALLITGAVLLGAAFARADGVSTSGTFISNLTATCTEACGEAQFLTDPFSGTNPSWKKVNNDPICPMYWNDSNATIGRIRATSDCFGGGSYVRFNGLISGDGCAAYQITVMDDGLGGTNPIAWQPGFLIRDSSSAASAYPGLSTFPPDAIVVRFLPLAPGDATAYAANGTASDSCQTFGAFAAGDWVGACISGNGPTTAVNVFNLGSSDPGVPDTIAGGGAWPAPTCSLLPCAASGSCASQSNIHWGIWMNNQDPMGTAAQLQVDNFRTYSCQ
jgi:hypothetical protein